MPADEHGADPPAIDIAVPQSFRGMPRWWNGGSEWLEAIPRLVRTYCSRWALTVTGDMAHGSNAVVIPVVRGDEPFVIRLTPPEPAVAEQVEALRFWNGRGTVQLINADPSGGAMLLERLAIDTSLHALPVADAVRLLGQMMRRLAIPAPAHVLSTADVVAARMPAMPAEWERGDRPFPASALREALAAGRRLSRTESQLAVNADLHSAQVLRGCREPWLTVDPVLMRGDIAYDLARTLWTRIDEMSDENEIFEHFQSAVEAAGINRDHGRDWIVFRTVDYWLWGLANGLTDDPERCRRLLTPFI
jgi:streptomycin 6-kinase